jgi:hypothetical protein
VAVTGLTAFLDTAAAEAGATELVGGPMDGHTSWAACRSSTGILPPPGQPLGVLLQRLDEEGGPVQMHLDLASERREAEVARHMELRGRVVRTTDGWTTLLDPSGGAYCVTRRSPVSGRLP